MKASYVILAIISAAAAAPAPGGWSGSGRPQNINSNNNKNSGNQCGNGYKPVCCTGKLNCLVQKNTDTCSQDNFCCQTNQEGLINVALASCTNGPGVDVLGNLGGGLLGGL